MLLHGFFDRLAHGFLRSRIIRGSLAVGFRSTGFLQEPLLDAAILRALLGIQEREQEREDEEEAAEIAGEGLQDVRGLRAEKIFRHAATEGCAKTFILRPLHEDEEDDQQRYQNVDHQENVDRDVEHG